MKYLKAIGIITMVSIAVTILLLFFTLMPHVLFYLVMTYLIAYEPIAAFISFFVLIFVVITIVYFINGVLK